MDTDESQYGKLQYRSVVHIERENFRFSTLLLH